MAQNYFVDVNTSADSVVGYGTIIIPFNYGQFMTQLAANDETTDVNYFYLKGYRELVNSGTNEFPISADNIWMVSKKEVFIDSWGTDPWRLNCVGDFYLESYVDWFQSITLKNGMMKHNPLYFKVSLDSDINVTFDNCWLSGDFNDSDSYYSGGHINFINSTLKDFKLKNNNFNDISFTNTIIYNSITNLYYLLQNTVYTTFSFDNVISNRSILNQSLGNEYNVLNPDTVYGLGNTFEIVVSSDVGNSWDATSAESGVFALEISAFNQTNLSYLSSAFSAIDITGNTLYDTTWYGGTRDGIGALYFPVLSGVAVSAIDVSADVDEDIDFILSGNDPFVNFQSSSATYYFDDGNSSAVGSNSIVTHSFDTNSSYQVYAEIPSKNSWYTITTDTITILIIGSFNVTITIYDNEGNDVTNGQTKLLKDLTFSATVNGLDAGTYFWDFGDGTTGSTNPVSKYFSHEFNTTIRLSAYAEVDSNTSAIDTATLIVSAIVSAIASEYYVNIVSAYDVCANNDGTTLDPFNWAEFKGRVEISGDYLDTYRLSGSRVLSGTSSNRKVLAVDKRKNFTIRDWDVSSCGPWVLEVKDFSVFDNNSILSAAGCTLRNGIIYNKRFSSPGYGGQIILGTTYDMFIVYQGEYSNILIDPYMNVLSGTLTSSTGGNTTVPSWVSASSGANFNLSNGYSAFGWIIDDFETPAPSGSFDGWWNSQFTDSFQISSVSGSLVAIANSGNDNNPLRLLSHSGTSLSGDFVIETSVFRKDSALTIQGISIFATSANINNFGTSSSSSGCVGRMGVRNNANTIQGSWNDSGLTALSNPISSNIIGLKFERRNNSISAFYKDGSSSWQIAPYFNAPTGYLNYSDNVYVVVEGNGYEGFDYFRIAAESGLPNTFPTSSTTIVITSGTLVASATSNIIGSTIYLSGNGWSDNFSSATFTDSGQSDYELSIIDSVMTNFTPKDDDQFSACNVSNYYSTFNRSQSALEDDFDMINEELCQYDWMPPIDYPFTPDNDLYDKDIDYINNNKKKLRPFSGITTPPNPGKNYDTYPNYETGLFGYQRKDYSTSGN